MSRFIGFPLAAGLAGALLSIAPFMLDADENFGLGLLFRLRGELAPPADTAVVGISSFSAEALGVSSDLDEWPRELHAELIGRLTEAGASVIVMDIYFQEYGVEEHDRRLADALQRAGNVLLLERVRSEEVPLLGGGESAPAVLERRIRPIEPFERAALATAPFTLPTVPIRTGQFWTFGRADAGVPNMPVLALQTHALPELPLLIEWIASSDVETGSHLSASFAEWQRQRRNLQSLVREIRESLVGRLVLARVLSERLETSELPAPRRRRLQALIDAYTGGDSRYINYYGPSRTVETHHYHDVLRPVPGALEGLSGKAVFIGYSERRQSEQQDDFVSVYSERSGINLSGVEIAATAFSNLLASESIRPLSILGQLLLVLAWGASMGAAFVHMRTSRALIVGVAAAGLYLLGAWQAFAAQQLWLPLVVPLWVQLPLVLIGVAFVNFRDVNDQRQRVQAALGRYVPPDIVARLAQDTVSAPVDKQLVFGTCVVTDAVGFTRVSEALEPAQLGELISGYYRVLRAAVERNRGYVADISGDSMVAIWAAAQPDLRLKLEACRASLAIRADTEVYGERWQPWALPTGIGLDCGELLLGNIDVPEHYNFRALGDIVNSASRIQGLNRRFGTSILASEAALASLSEIGSRRLGRFLLIGKSTPIDVYELRHVGGDALPNTAEFDDRFARALRLFANRDWQGARRMFEQLLELDANDGPSRFYLAQCELLAQAKLGDDWSGTIRLTAK